MDAGPRRVARSLAEAIVRRPAPARRHGARHGSRAARVSLRRTALQPRRRTPRADAHRNRRATAPPAHDDDLRDARSGRGDDTRRPYRGFRERNDSAGWPADRAARGCRGKWSWWNGLAARATCISTSARIASWRRCRTNRCPPLTNWWKCSCRPLGCICSEPMAGRSPVVFDRDRPECYPTAALPPLFPLAEGSCR